MQFQTDGEHIEQSAYQENKLDLTTWKKYVLISMVSHHVLSFAELFQSIGVVCLIGVVLYYIFILSIIHHISS